LHKTAVFIGVGATHLLTLLTAALYPATVRADGVSIGQYLLDQKLAVPYEGDTKQVVDWCTMQRKIK